MLRLVDLAAVTIITLTVSGCGNDLGQVTGVVSLDGQPLRGGGDVRATVYFQPVSGTGATAVGLLDANGQYHLSSGSQTGILPGEYFVTVSATQLIRSQNGGPAGGRRITDAIYANASTSGFKFTVQPGSNEFNLAVNAPQTNRSAGSR